MYIMPIKSRFSLLSPKFLSLLLLLPLMLYANENSPYQIGAGIYDITGPAAEIDMMGYANPNQLTSGIHSRLWARAFIVVEPKTNKRIVFVSADLGMIFQSIKQGVSQALAKKFGNLYTAENIMLSATHTHSGPGGYAFDTLFNFTVRGFYKKHYQTIVNGIVHAIERAHQNLEPGNILINQAELNNVSYNRSLAAYNQNPLAERKQYSTNTDNQMVLLKFINAKGQAIASLNWFAIHGVSMSKENTLISGDNKGYAAYLFEKSMNSNYLKSKTFISAFAQANEGDISPNIDGYQPDNDCDKFSCFDIKHTYASGQRQFNKAKQLFEQASVDVGTELDYRHQYIDMAQLKINKTYGQGQSHQTCSAALGYAFGAGTTDGPGMDSIFHQGQLKGDPLVNLLRNIIATPTKNLKHCQAPKPILLAVGLNKPAWVPQRMPVQLFKLGKLLIVGAPGEFTTMAGRRIKALLKKRYGDAIEQVVIAGLSNSYAGYVTTFEEYNQQNYEGGFTVFGPWTLAAYSQSFDNLAKDMIAHRPTPAGIAPEDLSSNTASLIPPVLFDDKLITKSFGSVHIAPKSQYHPGDIVHVAFWAGHPRNHFETMRGFLAVQQKQNNHWHTIAHDWDFNTLYHWLRIGIAYAYGHVYWKIPKDAAKGEYRIKHYGHYKFGWNQKIYPYQGKTKAFNVV